MNHSETAAHQELKRLAVVWAFAHQAEAPLGWGLLVNGAAGLELIRRPVWQAVEERCRLELLYRIATAGGRSLRPQVEPLPKIG